MHYDSETRTLPHNPLKALVAPRPIGWISAMSREGALNLAPYSFFNAVADDMVAFSSSGRKDAMTFAEEGGEFVCNLASFDLREAVNATSAPLPRGESEFAFAGLATAPSRKVRPPRVAAAPAAIECRWLQTVPLVPLDGGEPANFLVIGQVVSIYIDDRFVAEGRVDTGAMRPIMRAGYFDYFTATPETRFEMRRPKGGG
ncbi:flavin reductase (DIM6/NTAB) family NADH-FMN oxidoreductase RutF [Methylobacterium sp. BE186]|uniref:flavin reductase family protein n=1 Tax=Methylobacterium sp. BE186 TaxID=2817715 RepID=UPI0028665A29|nr:flavin reductase family protein [Methylobacterium sp. BE186]MDR7038367.1 flavin reductase (DIM6/NTAB) family NADH-FMN oxidoreductase RutF [Methylobacterium sp. BE186]